MLQLYLAGRGFPKLHPIVPAGNQSEDLVGETPRWRKCNSNLILICIAGEGFSNATRERMGFCYVTDYELSFLRTSTSVFLLLLYWFQLVICHLLCLSFRCFCFISSACSTPVLLAMEVVLSTENLGS